MIKTFLLDVEIKRCSIEDDKSVSKCGTFSSYIIQTNSKVYYFNLYVYEIFIKI
ncbi:unnamed protein product [Brugia timori]|uniref:Uncharacterized protein n=1 Tax=Brugia timori TaxID=42155 RepID=A0A0R3R7B8_9BILA|nr:unnamed protein product [Brugia timori]